MKTYFVTWTIDVDAASPLDAARQALEIQRDPDSVATIFKIEAEGTRPALTFDITEIGDLRAELREYLDSVRAVDNPDFALWLSAVAGNVSHPMHDKALLLHQLENPTP